MFFQFHSHRLVGLLSNFLLSVGSRPFRPHCSGHCPVRPWKLQKIVTAQSTAHIYLSIWPSSRRGQVQEQQELSLPLRQTALAPIYHQKKKQSVVVMCIESSLEIALVLAPKRQMVFVGTVNWDTCNIEKCILAYKLFKIAHFKVDAVKKLKHNNISGHRDHSLWCCNYIELFCNCLLEKRDSL